MSIVYDYDFDERMAFSRGCDQRGIVMILLDRIPGAVAVEPAGRSDDKSGTDYWVKRRPPLRPLSVDVKVREHDWAEEGRDDLALETWSVLGEKPGWTRDDSKATDYVLWFWRDTGRFVLLPFPALCRAFRSHWLEWATRYGVHRQSTNSRGRSWVSECVFVPRDVVMREVMAWCDGPRCTRMAPASHKEVTA